LERGVEEVLLLGRAVHDLAATHDHETRVTQVGGMQSLFVAVHDHNASRAAAWKTNV